MTKVASDGKAGARRIVDLDLPVWGKVYPHPMADGLLIGEVAKRSGVTRKALRLYEARGIVPRARRTAAGYRVYPADVLGVLDFVAQARRLGLTLGEIARIARQRRAGTMPCSDVRALLEQKAAELTELLGSVRRILRAWPRHVECYSAVCPQIEARGGEATWRSESPSARRARTARRSSSKATRSASVNIQTSPSSRRTNGTSSST